MAIAEAPESRFNVPAKLSARRLTRHIATPPDVIGSGAPRKHSHVALPVHVPMQSAFALQKTPFEHFVVGAQVPEGAGACGGWQSEFAEQAMALLSEQRLVHVSGRQSLLLAHALPLTDEPPTHIGQSDDTLSGLSQTARELFAHRQLSADGSIPTTSH